mgnify:CR=1 FL=1
MVGCTQAQVFFFPLVKLKNENESSNENSHVKAFHSLTKVQILLFCEIKNTYPSFSFSFLKYYKTQE